MVGQLSPNPGIVFQEGSQQAGEVWVSELIRLLGLQGAAVADLNQTITNPPTQAEVQAISDKIDELLAALRTSGILET